MEIKLSERLYRIAKLLRPGTIFADIGSDHAYLPCYVCLQDKNSLAIAGEVAEGPYNRARQTVEQYELTDQIDVRLGNGLEVIRKSDSVYEVVIAGMGGSLISTILTKGKDQLRQVERLIIQPNNNERKVRETLRKLGFILTEEYILEENGIIYEIFVACRKDVTNQSDPYIEENLSKQLLFGPYLMKEKSSIFIKKWTSEKQKLKQTIDQMSKSSQSHIRDKINRFKKRLQWIEEVLS
ncbi:MAG TPA: tRNA (adenine(22)-N(1))-methyltransferase TrmK [Pseudogracilibacillus sp.]|nr:tRNA (adenine(22)-N(1))-methyltransferase TrmK [Pseudogracilibacillus sp.]